MEGLMVYKQRQASTRSPTPQATEKPPKKRGRPPKPVDPYAEFYKAVEKRDKEEKKLAAKANKPLFTPAEKRKWRALAVEFGLLPPLLETFTIPPPPPPPPHIPSFQPASTLYNGEALPTASSSDRNKRAAQGYFVVQPDATGNMVTSGPFTTSKLPDLTNVLKF